MPAAGNRTFRIISAAARMLGTFAIMSSSETCAALWIGRDKNRRPVEAVVRERTAI